MNPFKSYAHMPKFQIPSTVWFLPGWNATHLLAILVNLEDYDHINGYRIDEPFLSSIEEDALFPTKHLAEIELKKRSLDMLSEVYDTDDYETVRSFKPTLFKFRAYQLEVIRANVLARGSGTIPAFPRLLDKREGEGWFSLIHDITDEEVRRYAKSR